MMFVAYCKGCLPTATVIGWATVEESAASLRHSDHPDAEDGHFSMTDGEWVSAYVLGDGIQTAANIVAAHSDRFV